MPPFQGFPSKKAQLLGATTFGQIVMEHNDRGKIKRDSGWEEEERKRRKADSDQKQQETKREKAREARELFADTLWIILETHT